MSRVYDYESAYDYEPAYEPDVVVHRAPSPGVAAVLSVILPGLLAGGLWFLATTCAYSAVLLPGFLVHGLCIWSAYTTCPSR
ncbi:MAG: hypothetical protein JRH17_23835 [Deltaproteobacteria bacterium]|nr:hypothetical protein [Deltaproteobacteria bacterium]